jgi:hypothetical protein
MELEIKDQIIRDSKESYSQLQHQLDDKNLLVNKLTESLSVLIKQGSDNFSVNDIQNVFYYSINYDIYINMIRTLSREIFDLNTKAKLERDQFEVACKNRMFEVIGMIVNLSCIQFMKCF